MGLLFLLGCGEGPPAESSVTVDDRMLTTAPSRIYFQNIRSTAYQWRQDPTSRTDYYLLRSIAAADPKPLLYPVIANIWMQDQAQVLLRSPLFDTLPVPILIHWQKEDETGWYRLDDTTATAQYELALQLYRAVNRAQKLEITLPGQAPQPLFRNGQERKSFQISLQDYLRLTEAL